MASVVYNIKGKYDGKAVKQAQNGFASLGKSVKQINSIITAFAGAKVFQVVSRFASETKEVFSAQNAALTKFNTAVVKSGLELNKLQNIKTKLSHGNFFDDDSLNNAMVMATQMGLTEEQIEKVMTAATDMASSGIMPLDQAVKSLSQTYSGNLGQLKKLAPELSTLTKKELENGEAVNKLASQYEGFSDAMSNTFEGRSAQWTNSLADLKAALGAIPSSLSFLMQGKFLDPLNKITDWLVDNRNYILNFFIHLPEVAKVTLTSIGQMIKNTFNNLPEVFNTLGVAVIKMAKDNIITFFNITKEAISGIMKLLDFAIGNPFRKSKDFVNLMLNNLIEGINGLANKLPNWLKKALSLMGVDTGEAIKYRFSTNNSDKNATWNETAKGVSDNITNAIKGFKEGAAKYTENWNKILEEATNFYGDDINELKDKLSEILGQDLPAELQFALDGMTFNGVTSGSTEPAITTAEKNTIKDAVISASGEIGAIIKSVEAGWTGVVTYLLGKVVDVMTSLSPVISNALNVVTYFLNLVLPPVIKILETWLSPIFIFIKQVAEILKNLFEILEPFITFLGSVVIKGVLITVITVLDAIFNTIQWIKNFFSKTEGGYRDIEADIKQIANAKLDASSYTLSSASTSSGASYTAQRDVIVNIYYANSFINGDAREIALQIEQELKQAHALGY